MNHTNFTHTLVGLICLICAANCGSNNPVGGTGGGSGGGSGGGTAAVDSGTTGGGSGGGGGTSGVDAGNPGVDAGTPGTDAGTPVTDAGSSVADAGSGGAFTPLCAGLTTGAGMTPSKGVACTSTDPGSCWKTCGPQSVGFKSETCTASSYVEQSGCTFPPDQNYACYKIPASIDSSCPSQVPQASQPCSVAACTLCNVGGNYLDSGGASKAGYCVCVGSELDGGTAKWSCASATAWPCPAGQGC